MKLKKIIFITLILLFILPINSVKFSIKTEGSLKSAQVERISFVSGAGGTGAMLDDWDPAISTSGNFGGLEPLVWVNFDQQPQPALATSWTLHARPDEGGNTGGVAAISFNLRQGVEFMDGLKWNASVCKWNFDRNTNITGQNTVPHNRWQSNWWFDPGSVAHRFTPSWNLTWGLSDPFGNGKIPIINETIIVSEYVVNFTLNKWATTPQRFADLAMISSKEYAAFATEPILGYSGQGVTHCVGTGAYQFVYADIVVTQTALSVKNENYWNKAFLEARGLFVVDDWYTRWYATPEARTTALLAGDVDASGWQAQNKLTDMDALKNSAYHTLYPTVSDVSYTTVQFSCRENNDTPVPSLGGLTLREYWPTWAAANGIPGVPLAQGVNHSVRRAISYAYDYPNFIAVHYADTGAIRCDSPLGTECVWNDGTVPYYEYNVTRAREVLLNDPYYLAQAAARGLDIDSADIEWNSIASTNPINTFTYLDGGTPHKLATLEKALNDLGFAIDVTISTALDTQWMFTKKAMMFDMFSYIWPTDKQEPLEWMGVGMNLLYNSYAVAIPALFNFAMMQNSTIDQLMADIPFAGTAAQPLYNTLSAMLLREANHLYIAHAQSGVCVNSGWNVTQEALELAGADGTNLNIAFIGGEREDPLIFELTSPKSETYTSLENGGLALEYYSNKDLNWTGYSLDGQDNVTFSGNTTIPMPSNGPHSIQVFGNDSLGIVYQTEIRYFSVDLPFTLINPQNKTYTTLEMGGLSLEYYFYKPLVWTGYSLDGQTNVTFSGNTTIPMPLNGIHSIQVFGNDSQGNMYQTELRFFTVDMSKTLSLFNPDSSSIWEPGSAQYINWTSTGNISNIKIEFYLDAAFVMEIISSTPNTGNFYFLVDPTLSDSPNYRIKITDTSNSSVFVYSDYFEISTPTPIPEIPGYNIFILIGLIGILGFYLRKKKFQRK